MVSSFQEIVLSPFPFYITKSISTKMRLEKTVGNTIITFNHKLTEINRIV